MNATTAAEAALDVLAESVDYSIIGPRDSRVNEITTTTFPYNTLCHVERDFGNGRWAGCSGVLIGPQTVLTAGHCLFSHLLRRAPRRIRVIPGRRDRDTMPYGTHAAVRWFVPVGYRRPTRGAQAARNLDYGVIILGRAVPGIRTFMRLAAESSAILERVRSAKLVTVAGYPGDRPIGTLWRHTERLTRITPQRLFYTVDTCPGHSGSPVWYRSRDGRHRTIIAVHTSGVVDEVGRSFGCSAGTVYAPSHMRNSGIRITPSVLQSIRNPDSASGANAMTRVG